MSLQFLYGTEMNHAEAVAKCVIEGVLPGTMEYQSDQAHGECDFELRYHSGTIAAVEVTASLDQKQIETVAAIRDERKGGSSLPARKCKNSWVIFATKGARIDKIRVAADECLFRLEQEGISEFSFVRDWHHEFVQDVCRDLNVTSGSVIPTVVTPMILIALPSGGGAVGASVCDRGW
jgi:hypothetical protein